MATMRTSRYGPACLAAAALLLGPLARAEPLSVRVLDRDGAPVAGVAVVVTPEDPAVVPAPPVEPAIMDQVDRQFKPHVLVIQTGSRVSFPNNDNISHHVYSFSSPKRFELRLYKGSPHPPLTFDRPGLVVLGCNIHDDMLGYILVVDTPYFAKTDAAGMARLEDLPAGEFSVRVWTPRLRPDALPAAQHVVRGDGPPASVTFEFTDRLLPERGNGETSLSWSSY